MTARITDTARKGITAVFSAQLKTKAETRARKLSKKMAKKENIRGILVFTAAPILTDVRHPCRPSYAFMRRVSELLRLRLRVDEKQIKHL